MTGSPVEQTVRLAKEVPADLLGMGTHGRTGVFPLFIFLGGVGEKVVRRAPCPVRTVRPIVHDVVGP